MPVERRLTIYGAGIGTWMTGCIWLIFHYFVTTNDEFGFAGTSPMEKIWLTFHAGFSFFVIWIFGVIWIGHIKAGWVAGLQRISGGTIFGVIVFLILTGYGLYYVGDAGWRLWVSFVHWAVGLVAILAFLWHRFPKTLGQIDPELHDKAN